MKRFLLLLFAMTCFIDAAICQDHQDDYSRLTKAYKNKNALVLGELVQLWHTQTVTSFDTMDSDRKEIYKVVQDVLVNTTEDVKKLFYRNQGQYLIFPSQMEYEVVRELDPDSIIIKSILSTTFPDSVKAKNIKRLSDRNSGFYQMYIDNLYEIKHTVPDTIRGFFPALGECLFLSDSTSQTLQKFLQGGLKERKKKVEFLRTKIRLPDTDNYGMVIHTVGPQRKTVSCDGCDIHDLLRQVSISFPPNISKVIIDRRREWALVSYSDNGHLLYKILFQKKNDSWVFFKYMATLTY